LCWVFLCLLHVNFHLNSLNSFNLRLRLVCLDFLNNHDFYWSGWLFHLWRAFCGSKSTYDLLGEAYKGFSGPVSFVVLGKIAFMEPERKDQEVKEKRKEKE